MRVIHDHAWAAANAAEDIAHFIEADLIVAQGFISAAIRSPTSLSCDSMLGMAQISRIKRTMASDEAATRL
jgi:hypothetical protein